MLVYRYAAGKWQTSLHAGDAAGWWIGWSKADAFHGAGAMPFLPAVPAAFHPPFSTVLSESADLVSFTSHPRVLHRRSKITASPLTIAPEAWSSLPEPFPVLARETTSCRKESCACALQSHLSQWRISERTSADLRHFMSHMQRCGFASRSGDSQ